MLKINSNFSDYYDCAIGSFVDSDVVINRKTAEIKVNPFNEFPASVIQHLDMYDYSWSYHKKHIYGTAALHCVGFCGQWYYFIHDEDNGFKIKYVTFDDIIKNERDSSFFSFMNKYHDVSNPLRDLNADEFFSKEFFDKYGPVVYCEDMDLSRMKMHYYKRDEDRQITIVKYPCLKDLGFSKVKDPYTALNELEHWYDVHARPDEAIVPVGDDITRLQAYGFDKKTSFRKAKEK